MKNLFIILLTLSSLTGYSKFEVYHTYSDFTKDSSESYERFSSINTSAGKITFVIKEDGKKIKIKCTDIWGYKYLGELFRIHPVTGRPQRVICNNDIVLYENGMAHMDILGTDKKYVYFYFGIACYVSNDLNSEMIGVPFRNSGRKGVKKYETFAEQNTDHSELFKAIAENKNYCYWHIRKCFEDYFDIKIDVNVELRYRPKDQFERYYDPCLKR